MTRCKNRVDSIGPLSHWDDCETGMSWESRRGNSGPDTYQPFLISLVNGITGPS